MLFVVINSVATVHHFSLSVHGKAMGDKGTDKRRTLNIRERRPLPLRRLSQNKTTLSFPPAGQKAFRPSMTSVQAGGDDRF